MTVNEMIVELQKIAERGHGEWLVTTPTLDEVGAIEENVFRKGLVTIWTDD